MLRRPAFGWIDHLARKKRISSLGEPRCFGSFEELPEQIGVEVSLREIERGAAQLEAEGGKPVRVRRKEFTQRLHRIFVDGVPGFS